MKGIIAGFLLFLVACTANFVPASQESLVEKDCAYMLAHRDDIVVGPEKNQTDAYKYNDCLRQRIVDEKDPELCLLLLPTYWGSDPAYDGPSNDCIYSTLESGYGKGYCDSHPDISVNKYGTRRQDLCYYSEALGQNDTRICVKITNENMRETCKSRLE